MASAIPNFLQQQKIATYHYEVKSGLVRHGLLITLQNRQKKGSVDIFHHGHVYTEQKKILQLTSRKGTAFKKPGEQVTVQCLILISVIGHFYCNTLNY